VAAKAHKHYFVYKTNKEDRTYTSVRSLTNDERIKAIAVMLSQNPPSANAIENAKELLAI
jgi:DNA repair protein RecN (Recombination protein N)